MTQLKKSVDELKSVPPGSSNVASALSVVRSLGFTERTDAGQSETKVEKVGVCVTFHVIDVVNDKLITVQCTCIESG